MKKMMYIICCVLILLVACSNGDPVHEEENNEHMTNNQDETVLPDNLLQKGDKGNNILPIQTTLMEIGYEVEKSGVFDSLTVWALTDIQLQLENVEATGLYNGEMKEILEQQLKERTIEPGKALTKPSSNENLSHAIDNPYEILTLVNKSYPLPEGFEPEDLTVPDIRFPFEDDDPKKQLRKVAADALEALFAASDAEGLDLFAQSGFRSYDRQVAIFASNVERHGEEHANTYSARPGESEHQTGLVMDVTTDTVGFDLVIEFGETAEGKWLKEHAHEFGYIIRYPEGKEEITKYQYEPWHLRYVGEKAAADIYETGLTLEEYLEEKE